MTSQGKCVSDIASSLVDAPAHVPSPVPVLEPTRQVRVWFGQQVVVRYEGSPADAAAYEATMRRRFAAGRVTNEAVPSR